MGQWKPGDVALVDVGPENRVALCLGDQWIDEVGSEWAEGELPASRFRPLVVLDPEDREQARRLYLGYVEAAGICDNEYEEHIQAALRSLITPPRPDEPTGLGAVVEDEDGTRWFLLPPHMRTRRWACWDTEKSDRDWSDIKAVKVLSEGVS